MQKYDIISPSVIILSLSFDKTTSEFIDWLIFKKQHFLLINEKSKITFHEINISTENSLQIILNIDEILVDFNNIDVFWHRKGNLIINQPTCTESLVNKIFETIVGHLDDELKVIRDLIFSTLIKNKKILNDSDETSSNKLFILNEAKSVGLSIPNTIITSSKNVLKDFYRDNNKNIITKNISEIVIFEYNQDVYTSYTSKIDVDLINNLSDDFSPSLFQENIQKEFEIRIFFYEDVFFSCAIFSNIQKTDFRSNFRGFENRYTPFKIPLNLLKKIKKLIKKLNYKSGSIDMLFSKEGKFVFLEINTHGQYDMLEFYCNFKINKKIIETMTDKNQQNYVL